MKRVVLKIKRAKITGANLVSVILLCLFFTTLLFSFFYLNIKNNKFLNEYNSALTKITFFNDNYLNEKDSLTPPQNTNVPIYNNGQSAILGGLKKLDELDYYTTDIYGEITVSCGLNLNIEMYIKQIKQNNTITQTVYFYCKQNSIINSVLMGIYDGTDIVKEKFTTDMWKKNDKFYSNIDSCEIKDIAIADYLNTKGVLPGSLFFDITNKTMGSVSDFSIKNTIDGEIDYYFTNFTLKPNVSTSKYTKFIQDRIHGGDNFAFKSINGSALLDKNGQLEKILITDLYTLNFPLGPINTKVNVNSNYTIYFTY